MRNEDRCLAPDELDAWAAWPASDRRLAHVRGCPRCRALIETHRLFHSPTPEELAAPHVEAADSALSAHLERITRPDPVRPAATTAPWWRVWFAPALRPALALAAVTLVLGVVVFGPRLLTPRTAPVLRGGAPTELVLEAPTVRADGAIVLRWQAVPGASHYRAIYYSTALDELGRSAELTGTDVTLSPAQLPASARKGDLLIRIVAMQGEDELAHSPAESLSR